MIPIQICIHRGLECRNDGTRPTTCGSVQGGIRVRIDERPSTLHSMYAVLLIRTYSIGKVREVLKHARGRDGGYLSVIDNQLVHIDCGPNACLWPLTAQASEPLLRRSGPTTSGSDRTVVWAPQISLEPMILSESRFFCGPCGYAKQLLGRATRQSSRISIIVRLCYNYYTVTFAHSRSRVKHRGG